MLSVPGRRRAGRGSLVRHGHVAQGGPEGLVALTVRPSRVSGGGTSERRSECCPRAREQFRGNHPGARLIAAVAGPLLVLLPQEDEELGSARDEGAETAEKRTEGLKQIEEHRAHLPRTRAGRALDGSRREEKHPRSGEDEGSGPFDSFPPLTAHATPFGASRDPALHVPQHRFLLPSLWRIRSRLTLVAYPPSVQNHHTQASQSGHPAGRTGSGVTRGQQGPPRDIPGTHNSPHASVVLPGGSGAR